MSYWTSIMRLATYGFIGGGLLLAAWGLWPWVFDGFDWNARIVVGGSLIILGEITYAIARKRAGREETC